jgi:ribosome-associated protein
VIEVTGSISLDEREIEEKFVRAEGPGGQNVNKVSSAVELRFDVRGSPSLPEPVRARLEQLAGRRLTKEGVLVLFSQRFRDQPRNRQDALDKLLELIREAARPPPPAAQEDPPHAGVEEAPPGRQGPPQRPQGGPRPPLGPGLRAPPLVWPIRHTTSKPDRGASEGGRGRRSA